MGGTKPVRVPSSVDFPAPLEPIKAISSPSRMSMSMPKRTGPLPNPDTRPLTSKRAPDSTIGRHPPRVLFAQVGLDHPRVLEYLLGLALDQVLAEIEDHRAFAKAHHHLHHVLDEHDGHTAVVHG